MPKTGVSVAIEAGRSDLWTPYELGAKPPLTGPKTPGMTSDCSGFIRRIVAKGLTALGITSLVRNGKTIPVREFDGSQRQMRLVREIPLEVARKTVGALLFMKARPGHYGHVAMVVDEKGRTLECRGGYGVCFVSAAENAKRKWDMGGKLDELFGEVKAA